MGKEDKSVVTKSRKLVTTYWKEIVSTAKNFSSLIQSASLLIVSGFAVWAAQTLEFDTRHADKVLLFSGVLILLIGCSEFLKTLNKKGE